MVGEFSWKGKEYHIQVYSSNSKEIDIQNLKHYVRLPDGKFLRLRWSKTTFPMRLWQVEAVREEDAYEAREVR